MELDNALLFMYIMYIWFIITALSIFIIVTQFSLTELIYIILRRPYYKMLLVKEGLTIGRYIGKIHTRKWIIDTKLKYAWMIPDEGKMIRFKKCFLFFASLESIQPFKFENINDSKVLEECIKEGMISETKEWALTFPIPSWKQPVISKEKTIIPQKQSTKIILRKGKKEGTIEKIGKTYTVVKAELDIAMLEDWLTSDVVDWILESPKKKNDKWIKWAIIAIVVIMIVFFIFTMR
jgi:hypothetical protein